MIEIEIKNIKLKFKANNKVFSPTNVDKGTIEMLSQVEFTSNDKVLDLGCGYGVVGILASKLIGCQNVIMSDISETAILLSKKNAQINNIENAKIIKSDGLNNIEDNDFTLILSNPPYHADFSVPKQFIEKGYKKLVLGGKLYMVTKRKDWYKNKLTSVFGGVKVIESNGYYIFIAEKRSKDISKQKVKPNKNSLSKKLKRKYKSV